MNKITFRGNAKAVQQAKELVLALNNGLEDIPDQAFIACAESESVIRLKLQALIDEHGLTAYIMVNGNSVWSKKRILGNLDRIIKNGRLYDKQKPRFYPVGSLLRIPSGGDPILSKYFYEFLHLHCGTIAHYNIQGWIATYPTLEDLKALFKKNEFGQPVRDYIPSWMTDAIEIMDAIEQRLFPLQSYVRAQKKKPQY
jgi:hypothetical protein